MADGQHHSDFFFSRSIRFLLGALFALMLIPVSLVGLLEYLDYSLSVVAASAFALAVPIIYLGYRLLIGRTNPVKIQELKASDTPENFKKLLLGGTVQLIAVQSIALIGGLLIVFLG